MNLNYTLPDSTMRVKINSILKFDTLDKISILFWNKTTQNHSNFGVVQPLAPKKSCRKDSKVLSVCQDISI